MGFSLIKKKKRGKMDGDSTRKIDTPPLYYAHILIMTREGRNHGNDDGMCSCRRLKGISLPSSSP